MIVLYTVLLFLLVAIKFLTERRAASLEKRYTKAATTAERLVREPVYKDGNSSRFDPYLVAKRQFQLGMLIQKRDRCEAKYTSWAALAERLGKAVAAVKSWKGKKLPYTFGVLDVSMLFALADYLGVNDYVSVRHMVELVREYLAS